MTDCHRSGVSGGSSLDLDGFNDYAVISDDDLLDLH